MRLQSHRALGSARSVRSAPWPERPSAGTSLVLVGWVWPRSLSPECWSRRVGRLSLEQRWLRALRVVADENVGFVRTELGRSVPVVDTEDWWLFSHAHRAPLVAGGVLIIFLAPNPRNRNTRTVVWILLSVALRQGV